MSPSTELTQRQYDIIDFIERTVNDRGYPPSVREIGQAVGLTSPSTVHSHLATLQRLGFLKRDPTKPARHRSALRPELRRRRRAPTGAPRPARG